MAPVAAGWRLHEVKLLVLAQNFRQGWGGGPESMRLLGQHLKKKGVRTDVFDRGHLHTDVGLLPHLPHLGTPAEIFRYDSLEEYHALLVSGPWQHPLLLRRILRARRQDQPVYYLPRGGLSQIEFSRARDLKKYPYLALIEKSFIAASNSAVYSSRLEFDKTIPAARKRTFQATIPDFVFGLSGRAPLAKNNKDYVSIGFMAEISPRKGLIPLIKAIQAWANDRTSPAKVHLIVGGSPRPGSERYYSDAVDLCQQLPEGLSIDFRGAVKHEDRNAFYSDVDIFAVPSRYESFGLTVIEALSAGCSLICTPCIGILEYMPRSSLITVAPDDTPAGISRAFAEAYDKVLAHESRAEAYLLSQGIIERINTQATEGWIALLNQRINSLHALQPGAFD